MTSRIWQWLLTKVINYLLGADIFGKIQSLVQDVALNKEMTGSEKKEKVLTDAKELGEGLATHILNLAIESAVSLMKDKAGELGTKK